MSHKRCHKREDREEEEKEEHGCRRRCERLTVKTLKVLRRLTVVGPSTFVGPVTMGNATANFLAVGPQGITSAGPVSAPELDLRGAMATTAVLPSPAATQTVRVVLPPNQGPQGVVSFLATAGDGTTFWQPMPSPPPPPQEVVLATINHSEYVSMDQQGVTVQSMARAGDTAARINIIGAGGGGGPRVIEGGGGGGGGTFSFTGALTSIGSASVTPVEIGPGGLGGIFGPGQAGGNTVAMVTIAGTPMIPTAFGGGGGGPPSQGIDGDGGGGGGGGGSQQGQNGSEDQGGAGGETNFGGISSGGNGGNPGSPGSSTTGAIYARSNGITFAFTPGGGGGGNGAAGGNVTFPDAVASIALVLGGAGGAGGGGGGGASAGPGGGGLSAQARDGGGGASGTNGAFGAVRIDYGIGMPVPVTGVRRRTLV